MVDPDEKFIRDMIPEIARAMFDAIDLDAQYLVIQEGKAGPFTLQRITNGVPSLLVSKEGVPNAVPIRDYGVYRSSEDPSGTDQIHVGMANLLLSDEVAVQKAGQDLTLGDIYAAATVYVLSRLEELPPSP